MKDYIGHVLDAKIVHLNGLGLFAELKDMYIEGLIHVSKIPGDYYIFDEAKSILIGKRTHKVFKIGQDIVVKVSRVDLENTHIDFEIFDPNQKADEHRKPKGPSKKRKPRKRKPRSKKKKEVVKK